MDTLDSMVIVPTKVHYPVSSEEMKRIVELVSQPKDNTIKSFIGVW